MPEKKCQIDGVDQPASGQENQDGYTLELVPPPPQKEKELQQEVQKEVREATDA